MLSYFSDYLLIDFKVGIDRTFLCFSHSVCRDYDFSIVPFPLIVILHLLARNKNDKMSNTR